MVDVSLGAGPAGGERDTGGPTESAISYPAPLPHKMLMGASLELAREREKVRDSLGAGSLAQESLILEVNVLRRQEGRGPGQSGGEKEEEAGREDGREVLAPGHCPGESSEALL